jgi:hypothetical protein
LFFKFEGEGTRGSGEGRSEKEVCFKDSSNGTQLPLKVGFKQCHKCSSSLSAYIFLLPWQNLDPLLGIFQTSYLGTENLFSNLLVHSINFIKCNHKKHLTA